ncbi:MAG: repressor LexA [Chloroflexi bacterium]|nr:repressor LexA [Chloroflexota bacterium]
MTRLTERQKKVLAYLRTFYRERGYPPTIRDIGSACGISSTSVVNYNLNVLERLGYIHRHHEVSRGIELLGRARYDEDSAIPVLGFIAAGSPIPVPQADAWSEAPLGYIPCLPGVRERDNVFALKVKGTSMIDALIDDGDTVVVRRAEAKPGDMAVVWLKREMETTLKRVYYENDRVRLQPANSQMQPIYTEPDNVELQGKVVAVIRELD